jgi:aspartate racemase
MRAIGIIGGIGPESTIVYYRSILALYREQKKDGSSPPILINSIDMKRMLDLIGHGKLQEVALYLGEEIEKLARAGAGFALLAANTPHLVFESLRASSPIPLLSIVEETCQYAKGLGLQRVGLFGTTFTMRGQFYREVFDQQAIAIITPDGDAQTYIHEKYMTELVHGIILDETKGGLLRIVRNLKAEHGIQGVILGGTELSLILRDGDDKDIPFLDTTLIHAHSAVRELLRQA